MEINKLVVYVVAWQSVGSGGFSWFPDKENADEAFIDEKANCKEFAAEMWEAAQFDVLVDSLETATDKIDAMIWDSEFENLERDYPGIVMCYEGLMCDPVLRDERRALFHDNKPANCGIIDLSNIKSR